MSDLEIDLAAQIDALWARRRELLALRISPPGPTADDKEKQRQDIDEQVATFLAKITALERIEDDKKASQVVVPALSDEQKTAAEDAMTALNRSLQKVQAFDAIMADVQGLFAAADTVISTARKA
jgi:pyruvate dehydrogenase complex dehydrogenase (E1) component